MRADRRRGRKLAEVLSLHYVNRKNKRKERFCFAALNHTFLMWFLSFTLHSLLCPRDMLCFSWMWCVRTQGWKRAVPAKQTRGLIPHLALTAAQEQHGNKGALLSLRLSDVVLHELKCSLGTQHVARASRFTWVFKEVDIALLEIS